MNSEELEYRHFILYFCEIDEQLRRLKNESMELQCARKAVPDSLTRELYRHDLLLYILTQVGKKQYNRSPENILKDGCKLKDKRNFGRHSQEKY